MPTPTTTLALGPDWLDPEWLISTFGLLGILAIVFAESGLLIGFFLPGDSLLFTAGLLTADGKYITYPLWLVCLLITLSAIAGDQVGYAFGRKVGPALFRRPNSKLFKQENVLKAHEFFEKYGARSIVLARFVPIVRTFTPIVAGVSRMDYRTFVIYNVIGGVLWGTGVTVLGYFLGQIPFVKANIEMILIGIVVVSVVPIAIELLRARMAAKRGTTREEKAAAEEAIRETREHYADQQSPYGGQPYPNDGAQPYGGQPQPGGGQVYGGGAQQHRGGQVYGSGQQYGGQPYREDPQPHGGQPYPGSSQPYPGDQPYGGGQQPPYGGGQQPYGSGPAQGHGQEYEERPAPPPYGGQPHHGGQQYGHH
ncbi:membrane protein [Micromonospora sagamiensis]|uniref:Membrane-associated protein n=1 Tax=Micromonospora sagamiensis TaxID=47875 RepID=A0A562WRC1_9ACTN|nr:membrane-associated protein [Micromonospora sagamiensis]BCL15012.1 membrane protein [Micromonospora sagamiensis]